MTSTVRMYDFAYRNYDLDLYRQIQVEAYGEDFGQTGWVTAEESRQIPVLLNLNSSAIVLEIGSGSGGYAVHLAATVGCRIKGLDINPDGIRNSEALARERNLQTLAEFERCDLSKPWPVPNASYDAVFANDVLCHIPDRRKAMEEIFRILKLGGRMLFSDALIVGGIVSYEEIAIRSSLGYYVYGPPAENERLIAAAGFHLLSAADTSRQAAEIAERRQNARSKRSEELIKIEGEDQFNGTQRFLACVKALTSERRLLRYLYVAEKGQG